MTEPTTAPGWRGLALMMIERGIRDCLGETGDLPREHREPARRRAAQWLASQAGRDLCDTLGLDPDYLERLINERQGGPAAPRRRVRRPDNPWAMPVREADTRDALFEERLPNRWARSGTH
jgi:hypothetical protein